VHASLAAVAKVARSATKHMRSAYAAERTALTALGGAAACGLVPELLAVGARAQNADWPILLLRPAGQQLAQWVAARVAAAREAAAEAQGRSGGTAGAVEAAAAAAAADARCAAATAVTLRLLEALAAAHAVGVTHCDVRPANVVLVGDAALLIDWGSAAVAPREDAAGRGVAAYADARVFSQGSFVARPSQDAAGALYTWLAIAMGAGCEAPWLSAADALRSSDDAVVARDDWLAARRLDTGDERVHYIASALEALLKDPDAESCARIARSAVQSVSGGE